MITIADGVYVSRCLMFADDGGTKTFVVLGRNEGRWFLQFTRRALCTCGECSGPVELMSRTLPAPEGCTEAEALVVLANVRDTLRRATAELGDTPEIDDLFEVDSDVASVFIDRLAERPWAKVTPIAIGPFGPVQGGAA